MGRIDIRPPDDWQTMTEQQKQDWIGALFAEVMAGEAP
jgi:hypothetical protein